MNIELPDLSLMRGDLFLEREIPYFRPKKDFGWFEVGVTCRNSLHQSIDIAHVKMDS